MKILTIVLIMIITTSAYVTVFAASAQVRGIEIRDLEGALGVNSAQESLTKHDPFKIGTLAFPVLSTNLILLVTWSLYNKKRLPSIIKKIHDFIFNFEISHKIAFLVIASMLVIYAGFSVSEIEHSKEEYWGDYSAVKERVHDWSISEITHKFDVHVRYLLLSTSFNVFGNIRVIPFIASLALLLLTYYITVQISKKRISGIISMIILLQSHLFSVYRATATYDNFWTLFYLLSLCLIYKKWALSPISYVLSIFSKGLSTIFLPMTLFFIYRSNIPRKNKIGILIQYGIIILVLVAGFFVGYKSQDPLLREFNPYDFFAGFTEEGTFLQFDGLVLVFLLPLIIGLFLTSRRGILQADSIMVLITGVLLSAPLLAGLTLMTNQPYRFVPLIVFFAIGVGVLLSNKINTPVTRLEKNVSTVVFLITIATVLILLTLSIFPTLIEPHWRGFIVEE